MPESHRVQVEEYKTENFFELNKMALQITNSTKRYLLPQCQESTQMKNPPCFPQQSVPFLMVRHYTYA